LRTMRCQNSDLEVKPVVAWDTYQFPVLTAHSLGSPSAHSKQNAFFTSIIQTQYGILSQMRIEAFKVLAGIFVTTDWYFRYDNETFPRTI
jgi:hypothetical protein